MSTLIPEPQWATGASAVIETPNSDKIQAGWLEREVPPARFVNWLANNAGAWIGNFASMSGRYASLDAFAFYAEDDEYGFVQAGYSTPPWLRLAQNNVGSGINVVDHGGIYIDPTITPSDPGMSQRWGLAVVNTGATPEVRIIDPFGTTGATLTLSSTPTTILAARTNGTQIAVAYDSTLEVFGFVDPTTAPTSVYTFSHGATLTDVDIDRSRVYICGASGTGSFTHRALPLDSATPTWGADHGATVNSIRTDGRQVYIGGNAGTSSFNVAAYGASDGVLAWGSTAPGSIPGAEFMATDGQFLWVADSSDLYRLETVGGTTVATISATVTAVALTPRHVFLGDAAGNVTYIQRQDGFSTAAAAINAVSVGARVRSITANGTEILVGHDTSGGVTMTSYGDPEVKPKMYRKRGTDSFQPYTRAYFPVSI